MADEKEEDVFTDDEEKAGAPEGTVNQADPGVPPDGAPAQAMAAPPAAEAPLTFPKGTTAKDLAWEMFILHRIQIGLNYSPMPEHLIGCTKAHALKRYNQLSAVLEKIPVA